jgi:methyltransferase (TIGR00027 family)
MQRYSRRRNPLVARSTAEITCAIRAAGAGERDPAVRCPDYLAARFLHGFNVTTLAKFRGTRWLFVHGTNKRAPGLYAYEIMRVKFMDEIILKALASGLDELILLGAGQDSRPYRMANNLRGVRVIEVDHPISQAYKRTRVRQIFGCEPSHITYAQIDFTRDDVGTILRLAGHRRSARALFVWSGVSPYLSEAAAFRILSWIGRHNTPSTSIVFDACWQGVVDGSGEYLGAKEWRNGVARMGEPLRWGVPEDGVYDMLARFGLRAERTLICDEGHKVYLTRSDGGMHYRPMDSCILVYAHATRRGV